MWRVQTITFFLVLFSTLSFGQKSIPLSSPSGQIRISITIKDSIYYTVSVDGVAVISPSSIALVTDKGILGVNTRLRKQSKRSVRDTIVNPVPYKRRNVPDHYNELVLTFTENFSLAFRAYDDGVAYRFQTFVKDSVQVNQEVANFNFNVVDTAYFPVVQKRAQQDIFHTSFEEPYQVVLLDRIGPEQMGFSPVLVQQGSIRAVITESDLFDYPGMFLTGTGKKSLKGTFASYPDTEVVQGGEFKQRIVTQRKDYIARTAGTRSFPWRVIALAKTDGDLLANDIVYRLGDPSIQGDWSWVTPGISTEEWICGINLFDVPFKAGINTETYKYYIDFASRFGMQYVMLDAGWSDYNDLLKITKELNLEEVAAHAGRKNIKLILWTLSMTLDRQLEEALQMFSRLGVKAIMTDFMDRDDQKMVRFYHRIAEATAKHKIMVMFHGAFKNAGIERTYPHCITREGVLGSEYNIWSDKATPEHNLQLPFIRMVSGPMDYEPGFMENADQKTFRPLPNKVMSQGTRTHQLAMFVVYESPLQMFSGNPSQAWKEDIFTSFLASIPTVWDEIKVLDAKIGDYVIVARRKDSDWYIAAMTDWTPRKFQISLDFLGAGQFRTFTCEDGLNADKYAADYRMGYQLSDRSSTLKINMAPGGGFVAKLIKLYDARP